MAVPAPFGAGAAASALLALLASAPQEVEPSTELDPLALLAELCSEPRVPGTAGYARAVGILGRELGGTGRLVHREPTRVARAIPTRSDVLLFEDDIAESAFGGLRERWNPGPGATAPLPPAYRWNVERANVRGPVVDAGAGSAEDFQRAVDLRIDLRGTVALVAVPRVPSERGEGLRTIARRARDAGCGALLVAPVRPGPGPNDHVLADTSPSAGQEERLVLPVAPIRTAEADAIRTRLRVRRVRGGDGRGVSIRVGPGPVEAGVRIECPKTQEDVDTLVCAWRTGDLPAQVLHVRLDERPDVALGGAPAVVAAVGAFLADQPAGAGSAERATRLVFGPAATAGVTAEIGCVLAPTEDRAGPSRLAPVVSETPERLAKRLEDELPWRLDAGTR
ncbi:MAG: hypothetical protein AAGB93_25245, partial [Planctomycetota bacterium]